MLIQITNPDVEPITVEQAKDYLRVDHDLDDERIAGMISQARSVIENRTGIALARCKYKWMPGADYIEHLYDGAHKADIDMFNSICSNFRINRGA